MSTCRATAGGRRSSSCRAAISSVASGTLSVRPSVVVSDRVSFRHRPRTAPAVSVGQAAESGQHRGEHSAPQGARSARRSDRSTRRPAPRRPAPSVSAAVAGPGRISREQVTRWCRVSARVGALWRTNSSRRTTLVRCRTVPTAVGCDAGEAGRRAGPRIPRSAGRSGSTCLLLPDARRASPPAEAGPRQRWARAGTRARAMRSAVPTRVVRKSRDSIARERRARQQLALAPCGACRGGRPRGRLTGWQTAALLMPGGHREA